MNESKPSDLAGLHEMMLDDDDERNRFAISILIPSITPTTAPHRASKTRSDGGNSGTGAQEEASRTPGRRSQASRRRHIPRRLSSNIEADEP